MGYIRAVIPLEDYRLRMEFNTGSSVTVDLSPKLKTARFAELADQSVFNHVKIHNEVIIWGDGVLKIPVHELVEVAITGM